MRYWLMKTEPSEFGIDDLAKRPRKTEPWDGVRNYQARNMMRDEMKKGDRVFIYHSNCEEPGIVGTARVVREGYPDPTAFDPEDKHYDPKSDPATPALVPGRRRVRTQAPAHHPPRRAEGAGRPRRDGARAPRQPALGDAGERGGVGVHPVAGMTTPPPGTPPPAGAGSGAVRHGSGRDRTPPPQRRNSRYAGFPVSSRYSYPTSSRNDWKSPRSAAGTWRPISTRP